VFFGGDAGSASKINGTRISSADKNADTFAPLRFVAAGEERCESGGSAGFCHDAQHSPEGLLGLLNCGVSNKYNATHKSLRDGKH
jgi:hypothetical protein